MTMGKAIFTFDKRRKLHTFSHFSFGEGVPPNNVINEYSKHVLETSTLKIANFFSVVLLVKMHSTVSYTIKILFLLDSPHVLEKHPFSGIPSTHFFVYRIMLYEN